MTFRKHCFTGLVKYNTLQR